MSTTANARRAKTTDWTLIVIDHGGGPPSVLTAFQLQVARLFFSLPASAGFLLAGGAALAPST